MWLLKPLTNVQKLILPFIQIGLWIFLYEVLNRYLRKTGVFTPTRGVAWGISVEYYFFWYVIIVGLVNLAYLIFRKYYLIWLCLGLLGFFFVVSPTMYTYPYKTSPTL